LTPDEVESCIALASSFETLAPQQVGDLISLVGIRKA
jgi:hypothetical protein